MEWNKTAHLRLSPIELTVVRLVKGTCRTPTIVMGGSFSAPLVISIFSCITYPNHNSQNVVTASEGIPVPAIKFVSKLLRFGNIISRKVLSNCKRRMLNAGELGITILFVPYDASSDVIIAVCTSTEEGWREWQSFHCRASQGPA